jgi:hypothetical protein
MKCIRASADAPAGSCQPARQEGQGCTSGDECYATYGCVGGRCKP